MDVRIKLYKLDELDKNLKVTVHKTGKMGFTSDAATKLKLPTNKSADIGFNEADLTDKNLYLFIYPEDKKGQFKVIKAGQYYYLNTKVLFDNLKIDYTKDTISYEIVPEDVNDNRVYVLKRKLKLKKERSNFEDDSF